MRGIFGIAFTHVFSVWTLAVTLREWEVLSTDVRTKKLELCLGWLSGGVEDVLLILLLCFISSRFLYIGGMLSLRSILIIIPETRRRAEKNEYNHCLLFGYFFQSPSGARTWCDLTPGIFPLFQVPNSPDAENGHQIGVPDSLLSPTKQNMRTEKAPKRTPKR